MAEPPKEFPQTGADGQGQVSPQLGAFWLPHGNSAPPAGHDPDFGTPSYAEGAGDVHIPDYHPPERIPDHPFKVNKYYDVQDEEWKIRVREGRFYLTTNNSPTASPVHVLGASNGENPPATGVVNEVMDIFQVTGDSGFPSFGNSNASLAPALALPKEFTDDDAAHGYAFFGNSDNYNPAEATWVYLRYVLKHNTSGMELAGIDNKLNVITIPNSSHAHAVYGAVNKPINAVAAVDKNDNASAPDFQLMRADQTVAASLNGLAISGDRERYGVYYILLAKVEPTNTRTGPLVTQYIHENITLSVSTTPVTAYSDGYGEA